MICTAIQAATIAIARVQSKFSMSITSCSTYGKLIQGLFGARIAHDGRPAPLRLPGFSYDQRDPACERESTQNRRERNGLLGVNAGLKGANVDNFLAGCMGGRLHRTTKLLGAPGGSITFAPVL